ncbi:MAG: winged helix-turn-helix domain-containing protein [Candidatus Methanoperedens sp.]|nr:winged helix-turn-helix domain-containing protein [Candidatus Methanoperedens sp.]MCZ7370868.1 winged helix-turn-helix domain-containing protein [Candidatus Methanoperedens sp.]
MYTNKKIEEYANEMPLELRRAINALNDNLRLAIFFILLKYGELPFSQIMTELEIPPEYSSKLTYHLKILEKGAFIKNEYTRKEGIDSYSFYDLTEFGEDIIKGLMDTLNVPRLVNEPIKGTASSETKPLDIKLVEMPEIKHNEQFRETASGRTKTVVKISATAG